MSANPGIISVWYWEGDEDGTGESVYVEYAGAGKRYTRIVETDSGFVTAERTNSVPADAVRFYPRD